MKLPAPVERFLLLLMFIVFIAVISRDLTTVSKGPDYCAMANFRQCKVSDRGEWVQVTTPNGTHMIYLQNGKVVGIQ